MRNHLIQIIKILGLFVFSSCIVTAQECNDNMLVDTPTERFLNQGNGTVLDQNTQLIWKICSEGQVHNNQSGNCDGEARLFVLNEALAFEENINAEGFAGQSDWRVPNIKELSSIAELSCVNPAINIFVFKNTPSGQYWSSTPTSTVFSPTLTYFKCINFGNGLTDHTCGGSSGGMGGMGGTGGGAVVIPEAYLRFVRN